LSLLYKVFDFTNNYPRGLKVLLKFKDNNSKILADIFSFSLLLMKRAFSSKLRTDLIST